MVNKKRKYQKKNFFQWLKRNEETVSSLRKMPYKKYLRSKHWRKTRLKRIRKSKWSCDICGVKQKRFEVHHKTYKRRGKERMSDLMTLCRSCHRDQHPEHQ